LVVFTENRNVYLSAEPITALNIDIVATDMSELRVHLSALTIGKGAKRRFSRAEKTSCGHKKDE
jgi:hypothetical protein